MTEHSDRADLAYESALGALHASGGELTEWADSSLRSVSRGDTDVDAAIRSGLARIRQEHAAKRTEVAPDYRRWA